MRQVGDLWVWVDHGAQRVMLGNKAAALSQGAAAGENPIEIDPVERPSPDLFVPLGTYALSGGPAVALHVALDASLGRDLGALSGLLAPLAVAQPPQITLHYSASPKGRGLWQGGQELARGPLRGEGAAHGFNLIFELIRVLLSHQPVMAILHGSALRWRGRNLIFLGESGAGKSTLSALLAARGGQYLGDDNVALLAPSHGIAPLPLSPTVKEGAWPLLASPYPALMAQPVYHKGPLPFRFLPDAPFLRAPDAGPPDLLVFPRFDPKASPRRVALTPIETLLHLSHSGLWLSPEHGEALIDWAATCPAIALGHGPDLDQTIALLDAAV